MKSMIFYKPLFALLCVFLLNSGFSYQKQLTKNIAIHKNEQSGHSSAMDKLYAETVVHYNKAKRNNRELVHVVVCVTDNQGNLYKGLGPDGAELFTNLFNPDGLDENIEINQFVVQGTEGYYGLWLQPGKKDKWRKGVYVLGYRLKNATHQCAGLIKLEF